MQASTITGRAPGQTLEDGCTWLEENNVTLTEVHCTEYANCAFSAGLTAGHEDELYIAWERFDGVDDDPQRPLGETGLLLLRPDELSGLIAAAASALWKYHESKLPQGNEPTPTP